ncbi:hypothetical protein R3P38DRAFT_2936597 [Favolaschia claudopus]|uniref:Secreted protein n=1 Tax=Favolaschia claudopus TaxID=2862362 RepID=A0AAW0BP41_9AGAR
MSETCLFLRVVAWSSLVVAAIHQQFTQLWSCSAHFLFIPHSFCVSTSMNCHVSLTIDVEAVSQPFLVVLSHIAPRFASLKSQPFSCSQLSSLI